MNKKPQISLFLLKLIIIRIIEKNISNIDFFMEKMV